jgi:hypothetical protein
MMRWAMAFVVVASLQAQRADVQAALAPSRDRVRMADYRITGRLVRVDAKGARTSDNITVKAHWFPGVLRVLLDVSAPAAAREHVLLEMRPGGEDAILVAHPGDHAPRELPFAQWSDGPLRGSFSYEDFLEPQYFWPEQVELEAARHGARDCNVVKSTPGAGNRTHYSGVKTWLDKAIGFPVYAEKTRKDSGAVKQFTYYGLRHDGGVWSASQVEVTESGKTGSTLFIIDRGTARANLSLADFSTTTMTRFQGGI